MTVAGGLLIILGFAAGAAARSALRAAGRTWANRRSTRVGVRYRWMRPTASHTETTQLPTQAETTGWCRAWEDELEAVLRGEK